MKLREYQKEDSKIIAGWIRSEEELYKWSADRFNKFPLLADDINENYAKQMKSGRFFPLSAVDDSGNLLGHFIIRYPKEDDDSSVRFGFVIVNPALRGKGNGKEMLKLGIEYVKTNLSARRIDLGVFENNKSARHCYEAAGFKAYKQRESILSIGTWKCIDMEMYIEMKLETERLILREYTMDDFDTLYEIMSDAETMQHYPAPFDQARTRRWIEWNLDNYKKYGFGLWALVLKETGEFIGDCGITLQNIDGQRLPEIGYHIHKKYWRRGFAKEAARAVLDWAFKNTDYPAFYSYCKHSNTASIKTAESIGMHFEKEYPDPANEITHVSVIHQSDIIN